MLTSSTKMMNFLPRAGRRRPKIKKGKGKGHVTRGIATSAHTASTSASTTMMNFLPEAGP